MTTYALPADGVYEFDPFFDYHSHAMVASGSGSIAVEFRHPGSPTWHRVKGALDAAAGNIMRFAGVVDRLRFTLSGSTGGAVVTFRTQAVEAYDSGILSGPDGYARLRVDQGEPGFWAGAQYGFAHEFNIPAGGSRVLKFETPINAFYCRRL